MTESRAHTPPPPPDTIPPAPTMGPELSLPNNDELLYQEILNKLKIPTPDTGPRSKPPVESLPVYKYEQEHHALRRALQESDTVIFKAGTGTGKTRAAPPLLLDILGPDSKMIVTETLRKVAEDSAKTLADDMHVEFGREVGAQHKFIHAVSPETRVLFCPVQSLLIKLEDNPKNPDNDPLLEKYDLIFIDEVHKETKDMELAILELEDIQKKRRDQGKPPLKVMLTSASLDETKLKERFPKASYVEVPGMNHPIGMKFEERDTPSPVLPVKAAEVAKRYVDMGVQGNIVIFMSGKGEIDQVLNTLKEYKMDNVEVREFYGGMSPEQAAEVFKPIPGKKFIVALTNAGQEGLTIPLDVVIDTCEQKSIQFDETTGRQYLKREVAPKPQLLQRKGRVGRTKEGIYHSLITKDTWESKPYDIPEMQRTDLTQDILIMKATGKDPYTLNYINRPPNSHIDTAIGRLKLLKALKEDGSISDEGKFMSRLTVKTANDSRMIQASMEYGAVKDACALAAVRGMNIQIFQGARENAKLVGYLDEQSDFLNQLNIFKEYLSLPQDNAGFATRNKWCEERGLPVRVLDDAVVTYNDLLDEVRAERPDLNIDAPVPAGALDKAITAGFIDSLVAQSGETGKELLYPNVKGLQIDRASFMPKQVQMFVSADIKPNDTDPNIHYANTNHPTSIELVRQVAPHLIVETIETTYRKDIDKVEAVHKTAIKNSGIFKEEPTTPDPNLATESFARALAGNFYPIPVLSRNAVTISEVNEAWAQAGRAADSPFSTPDKIATFYRNHLKGNSTVADIRKAINLKDDDPNKINLTIDKNQFMPPTEGQHSNGHETHGQSHNGHNGAHERQENPVIKWFRDQFKKAY